MGGGGKRGAERSSYIVRSGPGAAGPAASQWTQHVAGSDPGPKPPPGPASDRQALRVEALGLGPMAPERRGPESTGASGPGVPPPDPFTYNGSRVGRFFEIPRGIRSARRLIRPLGEGQE